MDRNTARNYADKLMDKLIDRYEGKGESAWKRIGSSIKYKGAYVIDVSSRPATDRGIDDWLDALSSD